jgi:DNA repair photolyase
VIFVNYEDFKIALDQKIKEIRVEGYQGQITFYASNYADLLAIEHLTHFHETFIPFFEQYEGVLLETRTKSANIEGLKRLVLSPAKANQRKVSRIGRVGEAEGATEIAFSLSPEPIAKLYESGTASLSSKLFAIQQLLELDYRV